MSAATAHTLADLALMLGLDKSTVSLALRGSPRIATATRERVCQAAVEHGYRPNLAARRLASTQPQWLGLVLVPSFKTLTSDAAVGTVRALVGACVGANLFNVLSSADLLESAAAGRAGVALPDGLFVWGDIPAHEVAQIESLGRPVVVLDPSDLSYASYPGAAVAIDNRAGGAAITRHLMQAGAQRLLFVNPAAEHLGHLQRWEGCRAAWLAARPLESLSSCREEELSEDGLRAFSAGPDGAIFCANDLCAAKLWHRLRLIGTEPPGAVQLAGFDGDAYGKLFGLTTAVFDGAQLAGAGFARMRQELGLPPATTPLGTAGAEAGARLIPVQLSVGRTTRTPPPAL